MFAPMRNATTNTRRYLLLFVLALAPAMGACDFDIDITNPNGDCNGPGVDTDDFGILSGGGLTGIPLPTSDGISTATTGPSSTGMDTTGVDTTAPTPCPVGQDVGGVDVQVVLIDAEGNRLPVPEVQEIPTPEIQILPGAGVKG